MDKKAKKSVHGLRLMVIGCIAAIVIVIASVYLVFSGGQTLKLAETSTGKYEEAMYNGYELEIKSQVQAASLPSAELIHSRPICISESLQAGQRRDILS